MSAQGVVVALLVIGCCVYAVWTLMPSVARRALAVQLLKLPLPAAWTVAMRKFSQASSGCGCDGCDRSELKPKLPSADEKVITFHPRR